MTSTLPGPFGLIGGEFYFFVKKNSYESENLDKLSGNYDGYKAAVDLELFNGREQVNIAEIMKYVVSQNKKGLAIQIELSVSLK